MLLWLGQEQGGSAFVEQVAYYHLRLLHRAGAFCLLLCKMEPSLRDIFFVYHCGLDLHAVTLHTMLSAECA
jgi:hypothetical protein